MLLRLIIAAYSTITDWLDAKRARRAAARMAAEPRDDRRPHWWTHEDRPPRCCYCGVEQTPFNEFLLCDASSKRHRP